MRDLQQLRAAIDAADTALLQALAERMNVVKEVGLLKKESGLSTFDPDRFKQVLATRVAKGSELGISPELVEALYHVIHEHAVALESKV
jgi:chorismate mutase